MLSPPTICWQILPEEEQEYAHLLASNLGRLSHYVERVAEALDLADFCDELRGRLPRADRDRVKYMRWKMLAARDAAVSVYNYYETRQTIEDQKGLCQTVEGLVDKRKLSKGRGIFERTFVGFADVRLAVAHGGRLWETPEKAAMHVMPGFNGTVGLGLTGNHIWTSVNGRMSGFPFTRAALEDLRTATAHYFAGYEPVSEFTIARHIELSERNSQPPSED